MKKIILTIIAVVLLITTLLIDKYVITDDMTIYIEIIKGEEKVEKEIYVGEDVTFIKALSDEFDVVVENKYLYKIDFLEAYDNKAAYIKILVNDEYSIYGVLNLKLNDKDKVSFVYTVL